MSDNDLISRAAAIECAINAVDDWDGGYNPNCETYINRYFEEVPAVDAAPVVHGRWVKMTGMMPPEYHGHYECSECGWHMKGLRNSWTREEDMKYCPNCGARMDGDGA